MNHLPHLISDLALILITATIVTLIFKLIKQPLVLGYIIAGFLVGPYSSIFPSIADVANVKTLAEIGVIFLLFSLGLEFSFKKLIKVGGSASLTAIFEIVFITLCGFLLGKILGWSTMDCLFLGGMLASSSTTIIIRAFDELKLKTKPYARVVFGVLVVEDIVVILLMVLLSTVAVTKHVEGTEMAIKILKLAFFLILWFVMGIFIIPTLLRSAKKILDDEVFLILSLGMCLGMVVFATKVGFSAELGAFIMGSIFAETTSAERIEHIFQPVKNLFGTIFFVSVGMMINPATLLEYGWIVLAVTLMTIFGKFFSTTIGALLSGQTLKQSVHVGMSMAQIGEFAFIVATLGMSLGVISDFLFPVAVAASAITTFTTPYMIKYSEKVYILIEKILPNKALVFINNYSANIQATKNESPHKKTIKQHLILTIVNTLIVFAFFILSARLLLPFLKGITTDTAGNIITISLALLFSAPFLWALMFRQPNGSIQKKLNILSIFKNIPLLIITFFRLSAGILLLCFFVYKIFPDVTTVTIAVPIIIFVLIVLSKFIKKLYILIESLFVTNLNSREIAEAEKTSYIGDIKEKLIGETTDLSNWNFHLVDWQVPVNAYYSGRLLSELNWRTKYGINVVYIKRDEKLFFPPDPSIKILASDHIGVFSSDDKLLEFEKIFNTAETEQKCSYKDINNIVVDRIIVDEDSDFNGVDIKNSGIRERTQAIVVGIERQGEKILSPKASTIFTEGDIIWIVGEKSKIKILKNN